MMVEGMKSTGIDAINMQVYQKQQQQVSLDAEQAEKQISNEKQEVQQKEEKDTVTISTEGAEKQNQLYTRSDVMNNPTTINSLNETDRVIKVGQVQESQQTQALNSMNEEIAARRVTGVENFNAN